MRSSNKTTIYQTMKDTFNPDRFVHAQEEIYPAVVKELSDGKKQGHWMWYIFPQLKGLGASERSHRYAINSLDEAAAYLDHPVLGARLKECTRLVLQIAESRIEHIFNYPDNLKFWSSVTLFDQVSEEDNLFKDALSKFFGGKPDPLTLDILSR